MNWMQALNIELNSKNGKAINRLFRKAVATKLTQQELSKLETLLRDTNDFDTDEIAYVINYINS